MRDVRVCPERADAGEALAAHLTNVPLLHLVHTFNMAFDAVVFGKCLRAVRALVGAIFFWQMDILVGPQFITVLEHLIALWACVTTRRVLRFVVSGQIHRGITASVADIAGELLWVHVKLKVVQDSGSIETQLTATFYGRDLDRVLLFHVSHARGKGGEVIVAIEAFEQTHRLQDVDQIFGGFLSAQRFIFCRGLDYLFFGGFQTICRRGRVFDQIVIFVHNFGGNFFLHRRSVAEHFEECRMGGYYALLEPAGGFDGFNTLAAH